MPSNSQSILVSSVGTSKVIMLDWMTGGPTTVRITAASTTGAAPSGGGVLYWTLDDPTAGSTTIGNVVWSPVSSTFGSTAAGVVVTTSGTVDIPYTFQLQVPVAALRFSCSAFSSTSLAIDVLQGRGW